MRSIGFAAVALCVALSSCSSLTNAWSAVTEAKVPAKTILVAENAFNIAKSTATNYIAYCTPNPAPAGCNDVAIKTQLIPAIKSGTTARDQLQAFLRAHPDQVGDKGVYDALVAATTTIGSVTANFKGN
ncbi:hypothetical protein DTW90_34445 [Neorhizobium sp. P12A]|uniref:hypothetical protein n=1 Tax=Neorhizobium sp. P12A TaxID=2268027 RepID=UPI0011EEE66F|nr:hypothetical protein [Neorhizobium sp. P12A]KAA0685989.1 hypothetical protein DTW90_34445 [Neorhizobium sp. P12A]